MAMRILLADDHMILRQGLRAFVEKSGFEVVGEASEGTEPLRMAQTLKPDVAVLDLDDADDERSRGRSPDRRRRERIRC